MKKRFSLVLALCMVLSLFATFVLPASAEEAPIADGDNVVIYCPSEDLAISAEPNEYNGKYRLSGVEKENGAIFTVEVTDDGIYFLYDGKYLTSGATGSNLTLETEANEYSLWVLEEADNGWYIKNVNAKYNNTKPQYIEYFYAFTTYSLDTSKAGIYTFQFLVQEDEDEDEGNTEKVAANVTTDIGIMYCGAPGQYEGVTTLITTPGEYSFTWDKFAVFENVAGNVYEVVQAAGGSQTAVNVTLNEGQFIVAANAGNDWPTITQGTGWWTGGKNAHEVPYEECPNFCSAHIGAWFATIGALEAGSKYEVVGIDLANPAVDSNCVVDFAKDPTYSYTKAEYVTYSYLTPASADSTEDFYKDSYTYADGVNNGTIQERGEEWADKPASDFWYLVVDGDTTVTIKFAVDGREAVVDDTKFRIWIDADTSDTARTTLYDFKVGADGKAYDAKHSSSIEGGYTSFEYSVENGDSFLTVVLDKATLGIDGEYGICLTLGQTGSTQMHSIEYDADTGAGVTYAPWTTTEFYEVFGGDNTGDESDTGNESDTGDESDTSNGEGTPEMGDVSIAVVVVVMLVAMAGVVVIYRRRNA